MQAIIFAPVDDNQPPAANFPSLAPPPITVMFTPAPSRLLPSTIHTLIITETLMKQLMKDEN